MNCNIEPGEVESLRYMLALRAAERLADTFDYLNCANIHGAQTAGLAKLAGALLAELGEVAEGLRQAAITAEARLLAEARGGRPFDPEPDKAA